jgi:hypothetical protein
MVLDEPSNDGLLCYAYNKQQHIFLHAIADEISGRDEAKGSITSS